MSIGVNNEINITIRLSKQLKADYIKYCEDNGHSMSKRIRLLILKDMEDKLVINK